MSAIGVIRQGAWSVVSFVKSSHTLTVVSSIINEC